MFKKTVLFKNQFKKLNVLLLVFILGSLISSFGFNTKAESALGIIIDEVKFDLNTIAPGSSVTKTFNVTHDFQDENQQVTLYTKALDFTSDNISGTPKFLAPGTLSPKSSLASWITIDKPSISLTQKGQKEQISFTINVPLDAEPGGKYAAVFVTEQPDINSILDQNPEARQLAFSKEIGPIILLSTEGEITKSMTLESLHMENIEGKQTTFFLNPPVSLVATAKNTGNIHLIPKGQIYIYKGDDYNNYVAKLDLNSDNSYTLPNSTRIFTNIWEESFITSVEEKDSSGTNIISTKYDWDHLSKLRIGKYNVKVIYSYDGEQETHEINQSFWVIPKALIILVGSILLLIILITSYKIYRKKSKKKTDRYKM